MVSARSARYGACTLLPTRKAVLPAPDISNGSGPMGRSSAGKALLHLDVAGTEEGEYNVIIETPQGSPNKFDYDTDLDLFKLGGVLPAGAVFPYDFGFLPSTLGDDGDPLDVLVVMESPAFTGCLVAVRLIGVIEAQQTERDGATTRNDRLIAVAASARTNGDIMTLGDLNGRLIDEIEYFFISYNTIKGKVFRPLGRFGPERAYELVEEGIRKFRNKHRAGPRRTNGHGAAG